MDATLRVQFWGVRGSIPSPGPRTVRYGGNTSCISIEALTDGTPEWTLVLDAGTGIRPLGNQLAETERDLYFLLTHTHWDHIQGFPFFAPLYQKDRRIQLAPDPGSTAMFRLLLEQMDGARFPLTERDILSQLECLTEQQVWKIKQEGTQITRIRTNHPGTTFGFRIALKDAAIVYIPDNELDPPGEETTSFTELAAFCQGADLLIHDAQYLEEDMALKRGWGHSVVNRVLDLAVAADVKHLVLFHHDPERTDDQIDAILADARARLLRLAPGMRCSAAFEGLTLDLPEQELRDASSAVEPHLNIVAAP